MSDLWVRDDSIRGPVSQQTWHDKDPSLRIMRYPRKTLGLATFRQHCQREAKYSRVESKSNRQTQLQYYLNAIHIKKSHLDKRIIL